ncbi:MAG TPA: hypothetical protein VFT69_07380 [Pseudolabrys sp.]|jgi:hypothetical protein|nr:hypothetical protein [Pseudolabrys sp.]
MPCLICCRPFSRPLVAGVVSALALAAAPAAHAFTFEKATGSAAAQDQSFLYPDKGGAPTADQPQVQFDSRDGVSTMRDGPFYLRFGHEQSFDQQYNPNNLFDPLGHPR